LGKDANKAERSSFLKKRSKRRLRLGRTLPDRTATAKQKSFASFLQKRRPSFCSSLAVGQTLNTNSAISMQRGAKALAPARAHRQLRTRRKMR
jgi:hypothetical protein